MALHPVLMKRLLLLLLPTLVLLVPTPMRGQTTSRAGVVVKFGDGSVHTSCVSFADDSISGLELLQRSGLDVIAQSSGNNAAVCKIGPDGCNFPAESCLACKFGGGSGQGEYWAYWILNGDTWRYSQQGAGIRRVRNGEVDGWAYGVGSVQSGAQPPVTTFDQICPALPPAPQPVIEPTAAPPLPPQPTTRPTQKPTSPPAPTVEPTKAVVASAPTRTPVPPTATTVPAIETPAVVTTEQPTSVPTIIPTPAPTATGVATATAAPSPTPQPTAAPTAEPAPATTTAIAAGAAPQPVATTGLSYAIFAAMLFGLLGAVAFALQRRR